MNTKIQKTTSKGQITLPITWRNKFKTDQFLIKMYDNKIEIIPADVDKMSEYTVFDAIRHNKGEGVAGKDFLKVLKKIDG